MTAPWAHAVPPAPVEKRVPAIANAQDPILMAQAMNHAVIAGRAAYLAGRMPKRLYASASSPLEGVSK